MPEMGLGLGAFNSTSAADGWGMHFRGHAAFLMVVLTRLPVRGLNHAGRTGGACMEWFVPAPGGRTLAVEDAGDRGGRPVMVHVGTPGSRRLYGPRTLADA
jgi:hypothetical protein